MNSRGVYQLPERSAGRALQVGKRRVAVTIPEGVGPVDDERHADTVLIYGTSETSGELWLSRGSNSCTRRGMLSCRNTS